jgi:hypothetical protein
MALMNELKYLKTFPARLPTFWRSVIVNERLPVAWATR